MITKVYEKIKKILIENYISLLVIFIAFLIGTIRLPYYINTPGGLIDVTDRVSIEGSYKVEGSFNMAYVTEIKATLPAIIYSFFNQDWDVLKEEDITYKNESIEDTYYRDHLLLEESTTNAIIVGFTKAGKKVETTQVKLIVTYVDENAKTDLKIGDEIFSINDINVASSKQVKEIINQKQTGDEISIKIIDNKNGKENIKTARIKEEDGNKIIGIMITEKKEIETIPEVKLKFKKSESGPSGGLMTSLAIYNYLTEEDITKGKKIVGTGTIDIDGNVGSIGGVKYKLKGAIKNKAEIFLVPNGENYEEAIKLKKENNYKINIIGVSTIDEALNYLMDL